MSRSGSIRFHDSSLHVWEEGGSGPPWWDAVREDVFGVVVPLLRSKGWTVVSDPETAKNYPSLKDSHLYCRKGDLEATLKAGGRHVEFEAFQGVANGENRNGPRYDFNKLARMPYLLRKRTELVLGQLTKALVAELGYSIDPPLAECSPRGITALEWVKEDSRRTGHFKPALGRADWHSDSNRRSKDGCLLEHGQEVYFYRNGRLLRGRAFYSLNNMWRVVYGTWSVAALANFEILAKPPADLRAKDRAYQVAGAEKALAAAIKALRFEQAAALRDVLGLVAA